jgi:adenylate cyclase
MLHSRAAVASDVDDATALAVGAAAIPRLEKDLDAALDAIERALSLNASSAVALYIGAELYAFRGEPSNATAYAQRALRLSPFDPLAWAAHVAMATAAIHEGRYDDAAAFFARAARASPGHGHFLLSQAEALALGGRLEEARPIWGQGLKLEPNYRIRLIREIGLMPAIEDKLVKAARLLGASE